MWRGDSASFHHLCAIPGGVAAFLQAGELTDSRVAVLFSNGSYVDGNTGDGSDRAYRLNLDTEQR